MQYVVLRPFKTPLRRFPEGLKVDDSELDGPLLAAAWAERGYLGEADDGLDVLRAEAAGLGIAIDRRWGAPRLREAIEAAKVELAAEHAAAQQAAAEEAEQAAAAEAAERAAAQEQTKP